MSPYGSEGRGTNNMFVESGGLSREELIYEGGFASPVINLSAEYVNTLIGDGSITNPYRDPSDT